jgi:hypothetical protein
MWIRRRPQSLGFLGLVSGCDDHHRRRRRRRRADDVDPSIGKV